MFRTIWGKLLLSYLIVALIGGCISIFGISSLRATNVQLKRVVSVSIPMLHAMLEIDGAATEIKNLAANFALANGETTSAEGTAAAERKSEFLAYIDRLARWQKIYRELVPLDDDNRQAILAAISKSEAEVVDLANDLIFFKETKVLGQQVLEEQEALEKTTTVLTQVIDEAVASELDSLQKENYQADQAVRHVLEINAALCFVMLVLLIVMGSYVPRSIARRLKHLEVNARKVAEGALDVKVEIGGGDEISTLSQVFNDMTVKLSAAHAAELKAAAALRTKVKELQKAKKATLELLEDVEQQKDIAERERAKDDAMLTSIGEGMIVVDQAGTIIKINVVAQEILALPEQSEGLSMYTAVSLFDEKNVQIAPEKLPAFLALNQGVVSKETFELHLEAGRKRIIAFAANPVRQRGQVIGAITIVRDVTKEREVDRMKTEFISLASHQLRTPLSAIRWYTEMLLNGDAGDLKKEQKDFAENVYSSTERMIQLVSSLLNISRIESGRIIVDPQPTNLKDLVEGVVKDLKAKLDEKGHKLIVSAHPELPLINIDPRLIRQVYLNLLSNSVKYTPKGGEISIFISRKDENIISQVTDNGYGVPKNQQSRLFEKFFRAENVAKVETDGTGLGLYLVKAIIESSGGKIWFESEEGKGTTFWFSLPVAGSIAKAGEVTID